MPGRLLVLATPLGNLGDLSPRALEALRGADCVACEDTRHTAKLLTRYDLSLNTVSCHKFNERARLEPILARLRQGDQVVLVSDGGTPGIADPGALLVAAALDEGIEVSPLPGPSAVTTLLSVSGLPADRYVFDGFLPHRAGERRRRLRGLKDETRTVVLFETPHRIREALQDIEAVLGDRRMVLGRELTKLHETILRGTAAEVLARLDDPVRGEISLALAGTDPERPAQDADASARRAREAWRSELEQAGGDRRLALRRAARASGIKRSELYRLLLELGEKP